VELTVVVIRILGVVTVTTPAAAIMLAS